MSKAEKYIQDNTRDCSNIFEGYYPNGKQAYFPWIHPKQARRAVDIAREEIYEWLNEKLPIYIDYRCRGVGESVEEFVNDIKQAMKDG
jgi:hypothetical protein